MTRISCGLVAALGVCAAAAGDGRAAGPAARLVFTFSAASPQQWEQARGLHRLVLGQPPMEMLGVLLDLQGDVPADSVAALSLAHELPCPLASRQGAVAWGVNPELLEGPAAQGRALLLGAGAAVEVLGDAAAAERVLGGPGAEATDVNQSTWGKIKEIFQ